MAGPPGDALDRRLLLITGLALYTVAGLLCALATDVGVLIASTRLVQGIGGTFGIVIAYTVVRGLTSGPAVARSPC